MTNKAEIEQTHFHVNPSHVRLNNPTFNSSFVNDSLTLFTPQRQQKPILNKASEYKASFEPFADKANLLNFSPHYHKFSKDAFERSRSYLSQYGSNLLSQNLPKFAKK